MTVAAARVDVLTAEVRALMVGSRQVTLSVYRQLDATAAEDCEPFGRVRDTRDTDRRRVYVVGRDRDSGALVRSSTEHENDIAYASRDDVTAGRVRRRHPARPPEEPSMNQSPDNPDDQALRLIGCRVNANGVVTVVTWHPDVTAVLKTKRWAAFIQDDGWQFPEQYLDHVARLMLGAGIRLYRIDGTPIATDADIADQPARDHTAAVNADIAAAKANALDPEAAHAAYLDAIAEIRRHTPRRPQPGPRSSDWNQPSSYELTPAELRREIERCIAAGWQPWEIATRFVDPDTAPEPTR